MIVHLVDRSKKRLFLLIVLKHFGKFVVVVFVVVFLNDVLRSLLPLFLFWVSINNKRDAEINTITSKD